MLTKREYGFHKSLKILMVKNDLSTEEMGEKLFVSPATIRLWVAGHGKPTIPTIMYIAELFEVSVEWLIYCDDMGVLKENE